MNLIEESFKNKSEKKKGKATTIILIAIIAIILIIIGIVCYLMYIQQTTLKVVLNGKVNEQVKQLLVIEEDGTVYFPIKDVSKYFEYDCYNGEYGNKTEEQSKCYIQSDYEIANFSLGSNKIYKLDLTEDNENYEYIYTKQPIKAINGTLYATSEAVEKAFNIDFEYDNNKNSIYIYTTPYLIDAYSTKILDYGYTEISDIFANEKAISQGMIVVKNQTEKYGVIDLDGNSILEAKYDDIKFLSNTTDFLVTVNNKKGILSKNKETKVQIIYDDIELMDSDSALYIVKKDNKYGVIDFNGNIKIYIENDEIGIDSSKFSENEIKNNYILANNLIPVRKDEYWGLFDKNGKQVVEFKYDSLGYIATNNKNALNLIVIPEYNVIVACKDEKYTLINSSGQELFATVADDIYMTISGGKKYYYILVNDNEINAIDFMDSIGMNPNNKTNSNSNNFNSNNTDKENENTNSQEDPEQITNQGDNEEENTEQDNQEEYEENIEENSEENYNE